MNFNPYIVYVFSFILYDGLRYLGHWRNAQLHGILGRAAVCFAPGGEKNFGGERGSTFVCFFMFGFQQSMCFYVWAVG